MDISTIVSALLDALPLLSDYKGRRTEESARADAQRHAARVAIGNAYYATEGYYAQLDGGGAKDVGREHEIAALWDEASVCFEPIDKYIADRLGRKARYWHEGAAWTDEQVKSAKIELDRIRRDGRAATLPGR